MPRTALPPVTHDRIAHVIDRVIGSFVADGRLRPDEADDVRSAVLLRMLERVDGEEIRSVDDYVARMTINAANDVLRARRFAPEPLDGSAADAADESPEPLDVLATRQMLVLLWDEIRELPLQQRRALLLHARDQNGGSAIAVLVFTGVATLGEIGDALGYGRAEMESLWDRLPLPDLDIATLMDTTRVQVISIRRAARERLERARKRLALPRFER